MCEVPCHPRQSSSEDPSSTLTVTRRATLLLGALALAAACNDSSGPSPVPPSEATHPTGDVLTSLPLSGRPRNVAFDHAGTTAVITDETNFVRFIR